MQTFDIYFLGEMLPDAEPARVREGVAGLFKIGVHETDRLFSGKPLRVKQGLDADTAARYRAAFRDVGALIQIVPNGAAPPAPKPAAAPTVAPAPSEATAPATQAASPAPPSAPHTDPGIGLAEPGAILDDTPPPPAADIDISGLEALPPNSGSLEDCRVEKPAREIPDISHLKFVDD